MKKFSFILGLGLLVAVCLFLTNCGSAEKEWIKSAKIGPSPRDDFSMTYDISRQRIVLFGGWNGSEVYGDTWEWDGKSWKQVSSTGPEARFSHSLTYDPVNENIILYGGCNGEQYGDTWLWDGKEWSLKGSVVPFPRSDHAMVYDGERKKVVMFGGIKGAVSKILGEELNAPRTIKYYDDQGGLQELAVSVGDEDDYKWYRGTWEWDGDDWEEVTKVGPDVRYDHAMAYDKERKVVVLFGGIAEEGKIYGDTWEWDGKEWTKVTDEGPGKRFGHTLVYNDELEKVILFGGADSEDVKKEGEFLSLHRNSLGDMWQWDGSSWNKIDLPVMPQARYFHSMAYNKKLKRLVLFGGHTEGLRMEDLWFYTIKD